MLHQAKYAAVTGSAPPPTKPGQGAAVARKEAKKEASTAKTEAQAPAATLTPEATALHEAIKAQGTVVGQLKATKADQAELQPAVDRLLALKVWLHCHANAKHNTCTTHA